MAKRFLRITEELVGLNLTPNAFDNETRLRVLGYTGPLVLQDFIEVVDEVLVGHGSDLVTWICRTERVVAVQGTFGSVILRQSSVTG